ncbi:hypothetical protein EDC56_0394 [Sinobacterium caligoides]|uniref:Uncharacterized protein n=1 Tax=Sinobacterium caligoides TaxID=933926 RepID=A0A3N2DYI0_9GAMM|nr:hypothetical protein [Sinobacterium caligoides]ROS04878.1 hypothetical protein EDC56_0394 [Sinobacterium caligoides]
MRENLINVLIVSCIFAVLLFVTPSRRGEDSSKLSSLPILPPLLTPLPLSSPEPVSLSNMRVITPEVVEYWATVCKDFKSAEVKGRADLQLQEKHGVTLTKDSACDWVYYALPVQDELNLEEYFSNVAQYIDSLKAQNLLLKQELIDRQSAVIKTGKELGEALDEG